MESKNTLISIQLESELTSFSIGQYHEKICVQPIGGEMEEAIKGKTKLGKGFEYEMKLSVN
jgi:hypothetical protein